MAIPTLTIKQFVSAAEVNENADYNLEDADGEVLIISNWVSAEGDMKLPFFAANAAGNILSGDGTEVISNGSPLTIAAAEVLGTQLLEVAPYASVFSLNLAVRAGQFGAVIAYSAPDPAAELTSKKDVEGAQLKQLVEDVAELLDLTVPVDVDTRITTLMNSRYGS